MRDQPMIDREQQLLRGSPADGSNSPPDGREGSQLGMRQDGAPTPTATAEPAHNASPATTSARYVIDRNATSAADVFAPTSPMDAGASTSLTSRSGPSPAAGSTPGFSASQPPHRSASPDAHHARAMVVIPCLNEADHVGALIDQLLEPAERLDMTIVVVDGGSKDGTRATVREIAAREPRVMLLHNPRRLQAAAINLAVAALGDDHDYLIRIDAHGGYPDDYCEQLLAEALATGADSVVVSMATMGFDPFQKATAAAQNSRLGNGGSAHRSGATGHWAEHGHHALMRVSAFRAVGGYDETFSHNEDAELDYRLAAGGHRIWMTDRTSMTYYPRSSAAALFRQYLGYGRGRARNMLKHRMPLRARQALPLLVMPMVAGTSLAVLSGLALVPAGLWAAACLGYGAWLGFKHRDGSRVMAGVSAMVMHLAWSTGFWLEYLKLRMQRGAAA